MTESVKLSKKQNAKGVYSKTFQYQPEGNVTFSLYCQKIQLGFGILRAENGGEVGGGENGASFPDPSSFSSVPFSYQNEVWVHKINWNWISTSSGL